MPLPIISLPSLSAINPMAAISTAASMGSAIMGYKGQKETNEKNIELAREQMKFQEEQADTAREYMRDMSGTAYQRAMKDMREAGLNPILAYSQGGASTPSSPAMSGAMPVMQNPMAAGANVGTQIMNSASNMATQATQRDKMEQEIDNLSAQYELTWTQRQKVGNEARKLEADMLNVEAQTEGRELENVQTKILTDFYDSANFMRIAKDIGINPGTLKAIFTALFGGKKK